MANEDCEDETSKAGGGLPREEAKAILQEASDRAAITGDPMAAGRDMESMIQAVAMREKANRMNNLRKREFRGNLFERRYLELKAAGRGDESLTMAVQSEVRAFNTVSEQGRMSAEGVARTQGDLWRGHLMRELTDAGLFRGLRGSEAFQREVGRELFELSRADAGEPHQVGRTGSATALQAANIINKYQALAKYTLNRAGAWIGDYSGYITKTTHDAGKMWRKGLDPSASLVGRTMQAVRNLSPIERQAFRDQWSDRAYKSWRDYTLPKLDHDRTFLGLDSDGVEKFMKSVWEGLTTGTHGPGPGMKDAAFSGPGNLAKRLSEERVLHFADADTWMDYNKEFGVGRWHEQIEGNLIKAGHDFALLDRWGTNPRAEYENDIQRTARKFRDTDNRGVAALEASRSKLMHEFGYLDGTSDRPWNAQVSEVFRGLRNIETMAHLGSVNFTHGFGAFVTKAGELKYHGAGLLERYWNTFSSFWNGPRGRGEDMRHAYDLLGSGYDGQHLHYLSQFSLDDSGPGMLARGAAMTMRSTGLTYVLNAQKAGTRAFMARTLGKLVDRGFGDLPEPIQRDFHQYGISSMEWDAMRAAPDHTQVSGRTWLTPDAPLRAGPIDAGNGTDLYTDKMRRETALKMHVYYNDAADKGIIQPGIAEKTLLGGTHAGTPTGDLVRAVTQFKLWPIAATRQVLGREWYGRPDASTASRLGGIMSVVVASTVLGYLRDTTRDLMNGREPADPRNLRILSHALMSGGGMGIMADLFFGELPKTAQSAFSTIGGPLAGAAYQFKSIFDNMASAAVHGDMSTDKGHPLHNVGAETTKAALDNAPLVNIWWVRAALNYAFLYHLQEWMNPGFHQRQAAALKKRTGQEYYLSPAAFQ